MEYLLNNSKLIMYFDEKDIENLRKSNKLYNKFINTNNKHITFNIIKNKYNYDIYFYKNVSINLYKKGITSYNISLSNNIKDNEWYKIFKTYKF